MDINNIFQALVENNIDLKALINLASNFLGIKNQSATQYLQNTVNQTNDGFTKQQTHFENSYFNMPTYGFDSIPLKDTNSTNFQKQQNKTTCVVQNPVQTAQNYSQNTRNEYNNNNLPKILDFLKLVLPLLSKQKEKSPATVQSTQVFDSTILKLPHTK